MSLGNASSKKVNSSSCESKSAQMTAKGFLFEVYILRGVMIHCAPSAEAHFILMHRLPTPGGDSHGQNMAPRALCLHPLSGGDRLQKLL